MSLRNQILNVLDTHRPFLYGAQNTGSLKSALKGVHEGGQIESDAASSPPAKIMDLPLRRELVLKYAAENRSFFWWLQILLIGLMVIFTWHANNHFLLAIWAVCGGAILCVEGALDRYRRKDPLWQGYPDRWAAIWTIYVVVLGGYWSVAAIMFYSPTNGTASTVPVLLLFGLMTAMGGMRQALMGPVVVLLVLVSAGLAIAFIHQGNSLHLFLISLNLGFALCVYLFALKSNKSLIDFEKVKMRRNLLLQQLERSEDNFRVLVENASDLISVVDSTGIVRFQSPSSQRVLGYWPGELEGWNLGDLVHPDDLPGFIEYIAEITASTERAVGREVRVRNKDGAYRYLQMIGKAVPDSPYAPAAVISAKDSTGQRRMTEELRIAKDKAETAGRAKADFLATMSHEIRTPMSGILGLVDLLHTTSLDTRQQKYLNLLGTTGEHLSDLLNDILDFSKIEAGKLDLASVTFDVAELVDGVRDMLAIQGGEKEIVLKTHIDDGVPKVWFGDERHLRQILVNLVGNAVKFTDQGCIEIIVRLPEKLKPGEVDACVEKQGNMPLHFSVVDTGCGIPEDQLERIFEAFSQADTSSTRKYGGTGLGLAISRRLVSLMGGAIHAESEYGKGATFHFSVMMSPRDDSTQNNAKASNVERMAFMPSRVLIVDDSHLNRMVLSDLLSRYDFSVDAAENGFQALSFVEKALSVPADSTGGEQARGDEYDPPYDIIIMDMQMPGMDGPVVGRRIRQLEAKYNTPLRRPIPIIILSANALKDDRTRAFEAGCNDYIIKPLRHGALERLLAVHLPAHKVLWFQDERGDGDGHAPIIDAANDDMHQEEERGPNLSALMPKYIEQTAQGLQQMELCLDASDFETLSRAAHTAKGNSALMGQQEMLGLFRSLENAALAGDQDEAEAMFLGARAGLAELRDKYDDNT